MTKPHLRWVAGEVSAILGPSGAGKVGAFDIKD